MTSCPFCATRLGTTSAPGRYVLGLALGLAFAACGEGDKDDGASDTLAETSDTDTSDGMATGPDGPGMTSAVPGGTSATSSTDPDQGGEDYGGFGETSWEPEPATGPGPEATDTGGEDTTSSSGSEGTGSSTGEPAGTDQGGEDYAGPESDG